MATSFKRSASVVCTLLLFTTGISLLSVANAAESRVAGRTTTVEPAEAAERTAPAAARTSSDAALEPEDRAGGSTRGFLSNSGLKKVLSKYNPFKYKEKQPGGFDKLGKLLLKVKYGRGNKNPSKQTVATGNKLFFRTRLRSCLDKGNSYRCCVTKFVCSPCDRFGTTTRKIDRRAFGLIRLKCNQCAAKILRICPAATTSPPPPPLPSPPNPPNPPPPAPPPPSPPPLPPPPAPQPPQPPPPPPALPVFSNTTAICGTCSTNLTGDQIVDFTETTLFQFDSVFPVNATFDIDTVVNDTSNPGCILVSFDAEVTDVGAAFGLFNASFPEPYFANLTAGGNWGCATAAFPNEAGAP